MSWSESELKLEHGRWVIRLGPCFVYLLKPELLNLCPEASKKLEWILKATVLTLYICGYKKSYLQDVLPNTFTDDFGKAKRFEALTDAHTFLQEHDLELSVYRLEMTTSYSPNAFEDEI